MKSGSDGSSRRRTCRYRIAVRGELTQQFVEPLGEVVVESIGDGSILTCHLADQAKLQSVLAWLYARNVDILSVASDDDSPNEGD